MNSAYLRNWDVFERLIPKASRQNTELQEIHINPTETSDHYPAGQKQRELEIATQIGA